MMVKRSTIDGARFNASTSMHAIYFWHVATLQCKPLNTQSAHVKFKTKYELPFTLLADPERLTGESYGVNREGSRTFERSTFVIDADGKVVKIMRRVNPETHAAQVLEALPAS